MKKPVILVSGEKESGKDTFSDLLRDELQTLINATTLKELEAIERGPRSSSTSLRLAKVPPLVPIGRFAFADPIKRAIGEILGIPDEVLWGNSAMKESYVVYGKTVRHWLQWFGTEVFRDAVAAAIWVHKALRAITGAFPDRYVNRYDAGWIISDCRFGNEYDMAHQMLECGVGIPLFSGPMSLADAAAATRGEIVVQHTFTAPQDMYKTFVYKVWRKVRPTAKADGHRSETSFAELDRFNPTVVDNSGSLDALREIAKVEAHRIFTAIAA